MSTQPSLIDSEYDPFEDPSLDPKPGDFKKTSPGFRRFERRGLDPLGNSAKKKGDHSKRTSYLYAKTKELFDSKGFWHQKVECNAVTYAGMQYKRDLCGFADFIAFKNGEFLLVQVTVQEQVNAHIREMLDPKAKPKTTGQPRAEVLKALQAGIRILVIGWFQDDKSKWHHEETFVDAKVIELFDSRRRK